MVVDMVVITVLVCCLMGWGSEGGAMKHFRITHVKTGMTLRQFVKMHHTPVLGASPHDPQYFQDVKIHYVIGEKGTPGFYYHDGWGTHLSWLDREEFRIEWIPQPMKGNDEDHTKRVPGTVRNGWRGGSDR